MERRRLVLRLGRGCGETTQGGSWCSGGWGSLGEEWESFLEGLEELVDNRGSVLLTRIGGGGRWKVIAMGLGYLGPVGWGHFPLLSRSFMGSVLDGEGKGVEVTVISLSWGLNPVISLA